MDEHTLSVLAAIGFKLDSEATAALGRQLEYVKTRTFDVLYATLKSRIFIPTSNETPSGAESIVMRSWDITGMAKIVTAKDDDLPLVDTFVLEEPVKVKSVGAAYRYDLQELRSSAMSGSRLEVRRAQTARMAVERKLDEIAAIGDAAAGLGGFLTNANVPLVVLPNGTWSTATSAEIIEDLNFLVQSVITNTLEIHTPDTVLLDTASFAIVSQKPVSADNQTTVLQSFLKNNPYITGVDQWTRLNTADAAGTGPRIMTYNRNPLYVEQEIPQEFEQLPPQPKGLKFLIPCHARTGGTIWHYPRSAAYADNAG